MNLLFGLNDLAILGLALAAFMLLGLLIIFAFMLPLASAWFRVAACGRPAPLLSFLGMRVRRTPIRMVTDAYIELAHRGHNVELSEVEGAFLANRSRIRSVRDLVDYVEERASEAGARQS